MLKKRLFILTILIIFFLFSTSTLFSANRRTVVVEVVEKCSPAVVNISTTQVIRQREVPFSDLFPDSFINRFFRDFFEEGFEREVKRTSLGSGVIIDKKGIVLTNYHVILRGAQIKVSLIDKREFPAVVIGSDPESDLAILKISSDKPLPTIKIGTSSDLMIGETVIAIGNPFGLSNSVTVGVISAVKRSIRVGDKIYYDFIQTDASINPGNSGGPLLNVNGELIGINTAIYSEAQGIGFAIPIDRVKKIVDNLITYGEVRPAWIGIKVKSLDPYFAKRVGYPKEKGVIVNKVFPRSPAKKAGILPGDIIASIDGEPEESVDDFRQRITHYNVGDAVDLMIYRRGRFFHVHLVAAPFPVSMERIMLKEDLGIMVSPITRRIAMRYHIRDRRGLIITMVYPNSQAKRLGLERGDLVLQVNGKDVRTWDKFVKEFVASIRKGIIQFLIKRGRFSYYVAMRL